MKKIYFRLFAFFLFISLTSQVSAQQVQIIETINLLSSGVEEYHMPKISPDGKKVAFGGKGNNGIFVTDYFGSELKQLTYYAAAGWNMKWSANSESITTRVNFWADDYKTKKSAVMLFDLQGKEQYLSGTLDEIGMPFWSVSGNSIWWEEKPMSFNSFNLKQGDNESVKICNSTNIIEIKNGAPSLSKPVEGEYLFVEWTPDYSKAAISVLGKGVFVYDTKTGKVFDFGLGEYPSWINNEQLIFMVVKDDGYKIQDADIYCYNYDGKFLADVTYGFDQPALYPSASRDGKIVFQSPDGKIYKMQIDIR
jgi:Tol biopolymer transport system component